MDERAQDRLFESFDEASGGVRPDLREVLDGTADLVNSLAPAAGAASPPVSVAMSTASGVYGGSANAPGANVQGLPVSASEAGGAGSTAESVASTFFESGFGMAALVKGLVGLFGGGGSSSQPLEKYEMPSAIDFESMQTGGGLSAGSFDQTGTMRAVGAAGDEGTVTAGGSGGSAAPITVNVQAMDAQSFLDHSDDIAQAVRGAMLSMGSINDVVNEL